MCFSLRKTPFLLGIAVLLKFIGPVHFSVRGKSISSTLLLLKNVSGSCPKKIFNNFCNSNFPSHIRPDGSIACSTDKANICDSYFSTNSSLSDSNAPDPPTQPLYNPIPSIIISARKVCRVFRFLKTDKASGPDGIPPRFLKEFAEELAPVLCSLFRLILISCTYPSSWKHALVQHVPKKGDRSNPSQLSPYCSHFGCFRNFA